MARSKRHRFEWRSELEALLAGTAAFIFSLCLVDSIRRTPVEDAAAIAASQFESRQRREQAAQRVEEFERAHAIAAAAITKAQEKLQTQLRHLRCSLTDAEAMTAATAQARVPEGALTTTADAGTALVNKERAEIEQQLSDLEGRKASLLKDLTPAHPRVAALTTEIEQLRERQSRIPQAEKPAATEGRRKSEPETHPAAELLAALERLITQQLAVERTAAECAGLTTAERAALKRLALAQGEAAAPVSLKRPSRSTPPRWPGAMITVTFTVLAVLAVRLRRAPSQRPATDTRVTTAEELEAALGAPVLGVISMPEPGESRQAA